MLSQNAKQKKYIIKIQRTSCSGQLFPAEGAIIPLLSSSSLRCKESTLTSSMCDMKGQLALRVDQWRACAVHPWVLFTVAKGFSLQFAVKPPTFRRQVAKRPSVRILEEEIVKLLNKHAIKRVPDKEMLHGIYSRYLLIPKKEGSSLANPPCIEQTFNEIHVQNVDTKSTLPFDPSK